MGLAGNMLKVFSPYHLGTKIGEVFKAEHEDYFIKKISKKAFFNFIAPYTALFLVNSTIQAALPVMPLLPLFLESLAEAGINSLIPKMVIQASSYALLASGAAAFFAGLSKEGMKENIKFALSPSKWNVEYLSGLQEPVSANELKKTQDITTNTQTISMASPKKTFTQEDANEMIEKAVNDGWTKIKVDGKTREQNEKLWLALQVINWKKERFFREKQSKGKIWFGDKYVPITATNFFPSQEDEIYQKWKQIKASLEEVSPFPAKASPVEQHLSSISANALAEVSHRRLVLPPKVR